MPDVKVRVEGVAELARALKQVEKGSEKELKEGFKRIAEAVAEDIRAKVPVKKGKARASVKVRASTRGAGIAFGGNKAPYYPWLDFGGQIKRAERPFIREGRYVYPTIKDSNELIKRETDEVMESLAKKAGFETKGGA